MSDYAYRRDLARRRGFRSRREFLEACRVWRLTHPIDGCRGMMLYRIASEHGIVFAEGLSREDARRVSEHWTAIRDALAGCTNDLGYCDLWDFEGETVAGYRLLWDASTIRPAIEWLYGSVWTDAHARGETEYEEDPPAFITEWER